MGCSLLWSSMELGNSLNLNGLRQLHESLATGPQRWYQNDAAQANGESSISRNLFAFFQVPLNDQAH